MKNLLGLVVWIGGVLMLACYPPKTFSQQLAPNSESQKEERIKELNKSIFCLSVVVPNIQNPVRRAIGTGFLVSENLLATAFHVKGDLDRQAGQRPKFPGQIIAWKKFDDGELLMIPLKFAAADSVADIALFSFDPQIINPPATKRKITPLPFAKRLPNIGEDILSIGYYGLMEFPFHSLGNVSTIDKDEDIYSDLTLMPGNSGSPLISMRTGEILGVNVKVMTMGDGTIRLGIAKRISKLTQLMKKNGF
jgi:S1-C subfamily serine protease